MPMEPREQPRSASAPRDDALEPPADVHEPEAPLGDSETGAGFRVATWMALALLLGIGVLIVAAIVSLF